MLSVQGVLASGCGVVGSGPRIGSATGANDAVSRPESHGLCASPAAAHFFALLARAREPAKRKLVKFVACVLGFEVL